MDIQGSKLIETHSPYYAPPRDDISIGTTHITTVSRGFKLKGTHYRQGPRPERRVLSQISNSRLHNTTSESISRPNPQPKMNVVFNHTVSSPMSDVMTLNLTNDAITLKHYVHDIPKGE